MDPDQLAEDIIFASREADSFMDDEDWDEAKFALDEASEMLDELKAWTERGGFIPKCGLTASDEYFKARLRLQGFYIS